MLIPVLRISLAMALVMGAVPAWSQAIGTAFTVRNEVAEVRGAGASPISVGDNVGRNEVVRTGENSATKLVFKDNTNLAVGPTSTVKLDRFVYVGGESASKVSVDLVRGAFRFTTGASAKRAYEIKTSVATIGVRGTIFDVLAERGRTTVRLGETGQVIVCARTRAASAGGRCVTLSTPGDTVIVTADGVSLAAPGGPDDFTFASFCGNDGLCESSRFATLIPLEGAPDFASVPNPCP